MRDSSHELSSVLEALDYPMTASFVILPGTQKTEDGLPKSYLAFVQCESEELIRDIYPVSLTGTFCFEQPPANSQPSGWHYVIKPPLPSFEYPGNLVFRSSVLPMTIEAFPSAQSRKSI